MSTRQLLKEESSYGNFDVIDDSEIVLTGTGVWNDVDYLNSEYKISLTTTKGNFFTTVASPFNTQIKMKSKIIPNQLIEKKKNSCLKNRRAVADIISTMLLMGVTISGATTLTYFVNDGFVSGNLEAASSFDSSSKNILFLAYDNTANMLGKCAKEV